MKRLFISLFALMVLLGTAGTSYAGPGDPNNFFGTSNAIYKVTISKIEISQDKTNWVTLGEGSQVFNIASLTVGSDFLNYVSNKSIPTGTYKYVRVTISRTMYIKGSGTFGGNTYYTTAGTISSDGGSLGIASTNSADYATATIVIPSVASSPDPNETLLVSGNNLIATRTLDESFTVPAGGGSLKLTFATQRTIEFDPDDVPLKTIFWPIPPNMTFTFR